jgi:hypothetical protein
MGFLGSIVHAVASPVEHLIGKTATKVFFPVVPISQFAAKIGDTLINKVAAGVAGPHQVASASQSHGPVYGAGQSFNTQYGQPQTPMMPYYGGGGGALTYPQAEPYYGGQPSWGSSIQPTTFYRESSPTYLEAPAQPAGARSWEDLALTALPFLL